MEEALVKRLLDAPGLDVAGESIHWVDMPQGTPMPAIRLQIISPGREYHHGGPTDLHWPRVQIDCLGRSYGEAKLLARAVTQEMEQPRTTEGIAFDDALLDGGGDRPKETLPGGTEVFSVRLDFMLPWKAAA